MKKKLLIPGLALLAITSLFSCSKDDDQSKTELLTQSSWKIVSAQEDEGSGTYVNVPMEDCEKDDALKFNTDHTFTVNVNIQCDPSDTNETGTWLLSDDEKTITIDGEPATLESISDSKMVIVSSEEFGGMTFRYKVTLSH